MSEVHDQYEAYPYPERDPKDEKKRLITGSPSHPLEIDHHLFGGRRDWSKGTRILVAGGGTGDALIQLAQVLTSVRRPFEITYLDLSKASRRVAEERVKVRGLTGITFLTGSLLDAPDHGPFDYIDCCGVLHHLPVPQDGFDALAAALSPDGGLGLMVYAPHGRCGVYPLQEAFGRLSVGMSPTERLKLAKSIYANIPDGHPFKRNPHLVDHNASDAGFYDLLLHSQDQPFTIDAVMAMLSQAELKFAGVPQSALYDLDRFDPKAGAGLDDASKMALAESLDGTIKTHIVYARKTTQVGFDEQSVPHLKGVNGPALAKKIATSGHFDVTLNGTKHRVSAQKGVAKIIAQVDGRRDIATLRAASGMDMMAWNAVWKPVETQLISFGLLVFSRILRTSSG